MKNFRMDIEFRNKESVEFEELDNNTRSCKGLKNMLRTYVLTLGLTESL